MKSHLKAIFILLLILVAYALASCTVLPRYEKHPVSYCKRQPWDTVCLGYERERLLYYHECSVYDINCEHLEH